MNDRPSPRRHALGSVLGAFEAADAVFSMGDRVWRWAVALSGTAYIVSAVVAAVRLYRKYSEWWGLGFLALAALGGIWLFAWLFARHYRQLSAAPPDSLPSAKADKQHPAEMPDQLLRELQAQVDAVRKESETLTKDAARLLDDKATILKENAELSAAVKNREDYINGLLWKIWYDGERPMLPEMPLTDQASVRERVEEMAPSLHRAADSCSMLLKHLLTPMAYDDTESCTFFLAGFVSQHVLTRLNEARDQLVVAINNRHDVRLALIGYDGRYVSARLWVVRSERILRWHHDYDDMYLKWLAADAAYHQELEKVLSRNALANIRTYFTRDSEAPPRDPAKQRDNLRR